MKIHVALLAPAALAAAVVGTEEGIPIKHELTESRCGGCHARNADGRMTRISYVRTTPEVWQQIIKRMVRLNGLKLTPDEAREIVRYLSWNNGLAPEELKPAFWEVEHRMGRDQDDAIPNPALQKTCNYCHTIGRVLTQRRTRKDYEMLAAMHMALFPGAETAVFRPRRVVVDPADIPVRSVQTGSSQPALELMREEPVAAKAPVEAAIDYLSTAQPLITKEWTSWAAAMKQPKLAGQWALSGEQAGQGKFFGLVTIAQGAKEDEFETKMEIQFVNRPGVVTRSGKGIVYTGYSWRGRSTSSAPADSSNPGRSPSEAREALMLSRDGNTLEGRWFWGGYDEFGMDVKLTRAGSGPVISGVDRYSLQSPSTASLKIFGRGLPADLKPADIDLGPGVTVKKVSAASAGSATIEVEVAKSLAVGKRDLSVRGSTAIGAVTIYDTLDYLKVTPDAAMGRLGGDVAPKQYAQLDAVLFNNGPDGKSDTADDLSLGPVAASWSLEEFISTPDDDDVKFVGSLNDSGLFTPAGEGPNAARKKQSNNYPTNNWGDVWVHAAYKTPEGKTLRARSYLVVTIPIYVRYDQPEVAVVK